MRVEQDTYGDIGVAAVIALVDAQQREAEERRHGGSPRRWSEAAEDLLRDEPVARTSTCSLRIP